MGKISAQAIGHSINKSVSRKEFRYGHPEIMTMKLVFPRHILGEAKTHRIMSIEDSEIEIVIKNQIAFNDEQMFSKNSASSRAIPFKRMLKAVLTDPFIPIAWQHDHSGMQGSTYHDPATRYGFYDFNVFLRTAFTKLGISDESEDIEVYSMLLDAFRAYKDVSKTLDEWWLLTRDKVVQAATLMNIFNVSKQSVNRLLEPFMWHCVVVTSTEWENFFKLRCPLYTIDDKITDKTVFHRSWKDLVNYEFKVRKANRDVIDALEGYDTISKLTYNKGAAEIHMMALAEAMWDAYNESIPRDINQGQWHIPYESDIHPTDYYLENADLSLGTDARNTEKIKISTGMLAYTSYITIDKESELTHQRYAGIHDKMILANPFHASPFEHCNVAMGESEYTLFSRNHVIYNKDTCDGWAYNMQGFVPYRYILENPEYKQYFHERITNR